MTIEKNKQMETHLMKQSIAIVQNWTINCHNSKELNF
jgi:hypothetical protein